jgi:hypothetical protein
VFRTFLPLAGALAAAVVASPALAAQPAPKPVPSLTPVKTAKLWKQLVHRPRTYSLRADCTPLRAVFYAGTDWLRLTTKLAANASPCADYYVSVPPKVADKTQFRPDQAWRIRALGPRFHALGLPVSLTFASSSPGGSFSTSAAGPWTPTLVVPIASGKTTVSAYYSDTQPGTPTITASADGKVAATQVETVALPAVPAA